MSVFSVPTRTGSKAQDHPRLILALLIFSYANGLFSSRRIERATYRDIGVRFVAANLHPDHDTIATFRRTNRAAIETAFVQVLLLARARPGFCVWVWCRSTARRSMPTPRNTALCATTGSGCCVKSFPLTSRNR
nr:transposase [Acetobacter oeni]